MFRRFLLLIPILCFLVIQSCLSQNKKAEKVIHNYLTKEIWTGEKITILYLEKLKPEDVEGYFTHTYSVTYSWLNSRDQSKRMAVSYFLLNPKINTVMGEIKLEFTSQKDGKKLTSKKLKEKNMLHSDIGLQRRVDKSMKEEFMKMLQENK